MVIQHKYFKEGNYSTHTLDLIKNELQRDVNIHFEKRDLAARIGAVQSHHQLKPKIISPENQQQKTNWALTGRIDELR
jgi:hypothetical protein